MKKAILTNYTEKHKILIKLQNKSVISMVKMCTNGTLKSVDIIYAKFRLKKQTIII